MSEPSAGRRQRVVIVGGGFGGVAAAKGLRRADADVTVVDRMNHHLFQPLLYQVAGGGVSAGDCAPPIRRLLEHERNATVLMAEVTDVDVAARQVVLDRGERLDYDHLIVAAGARTSYFGHDEFKKASFGLKTLQDAIDLRDRIFSAFEEAERAPDPAVREGWMTFVVVGGGATGVEVAGSIGILVRSTLKREFRRIDPSQTRVILVDAGERLVPAFDEPLPAKVARYLSDVGVTVRHQVRATAVDESGLTAQVGDDSEHIPARTVIWAAGVQASPLAAIVADATGTEADRAGRLKVNADMTLPGHPEIFAIGDMTTVEGPGGRPVPGLATAAIQQGRHVASVIAGRAGAGAAEQDGGAAFKYFDKGALAVVGRGKAVCEVRGRKVSGRVAFFMYLGVHLYYLGGGAVGRLTVLLQWFSTRFGGREARVVQGTLPADESPGPAPIS